MKEHRCPKCNKLLFKYSDQADIVHGKVEVETQHHCRSEDNAKVKDIKEIGEGDRIASYKIGNTIESISIEKHTIKAPKMEEYPIKK